MRSSRSTLRCARLLAIPILLSLSLPAHGWGIVGHRYANGLAVDSLPANLKPLFAANRAWIVQHAIDPDDWRKSHREEGPHHFIDLDKWGLEAAETFPLDYWTACGLYGKKEVDANGVVPWRIGQYYGKLVRAFRARDARAIVEISTWLGHYVADIHVPFHAVVNYDGQLTGQRGLHARFESVMVERQIKETDLKAGTPAPIPDPVAAAFGWARVSMKQTTAILAADKEAVALDPQYGDAFYNSFGAKTRAIAVQRLQESGQDLASLWVSAWIAAGKPGLPEAKDVHAGEPLDKPTADPDWEATGAKPGKPSEG